MPGVVTIPTRFYYRGDRTVIKTVKPLKYSCNRFYYLGDRTVIKTYLNDNMPDFGFYYLGDRTVIKTSTLSEALLT